MKVKRQTGFAEGPAGRPQAQVSEDRHPPRQGEPVWAGAPGAFPPAHAPSPLGPWLPLPPITAPLRTRLLQGAERSRAGPAPRDEHAAGLPAGPSEDPPELGGREVGGGGEARPYPTHRLLLRRPPCAVPEAPPPGPPQPPCPRPSPPPTHVRAAPSALRLPRARLIGRRLSRAAPLGQQQAASAYFLPSKPHLGFQPASGVRACAESALAAVRGVELVRQSMRLDRQWRSDASGTESRTEGSEVGSTC